MTEDMTDAEEITDRGLMTDTKEDICLFYLNPEVLIIQQDHREGETIVHIEV